MSGHASTCFRTTCGAATCPPWRRGPCPHLRLRGPCTGSPDKELGQHSACQACAPPSGDDNVIPDHMLSGSLDGGLWRRASPRAALLPGSGC